MPMSTPEFEEFDLEGLSLEEVDPAKPVKAEQMQAEELLEQELKMAKPIESVQPIEAKPVEKVIQAAPPPAAEATSDEANLPEGQMICPKCELVQEKAEQCSGCGVYVAKAKAAIGQSKIQITSTKF